VLEPRNNRLIAFPSFVPHEVRRVACPSGEFADSRFAINVWLSRARQPA
jgi:Rps23 Pro-64 3,4-dihydroxylase Tpa1-like proline 4-hydroxylase